MFIIIPAVHRIIETALKLAKATRLINDYCVEDTRDKDRCLRYWPEELDHKWFGRWTLEGDESHPFNTTFVKVGRLILLIEPCPRR